MTGGSLDAESCRYEQREGSRELCRNNNRACLRVALFKEPELTIDLFPIKNVRMRNGIYSVKFAASLGVIGEGLVVFKDGTVNGGDHGYIYTGSYDVSNSKATAKLKVKRWNPGSMSILGNIQEFDLVLSGSEGQDGTSFSVSGQSPSIPAQVEVTGRFLADLA
jgi:hypothetical protein